jgi:hypothetical protein
MRKEEAEIKDGLVAGVVFIPNSLTAFDRTSLISRKKYASNI